MVKSAVESLTEAVVDLNEKAPIRTLHVDDEAGFLKAAKQCLEIQGEFQVDTAMSVEEALKKMKKKTFDVIVSDYMMPGRDGLDFLKELREKGNTTPFIMFTGKGREEVAIKALNYGADQYLNKIGDPETVYGELAHGIHQAVEKREAAIKLRRSLENIRKRSGELATLMESSTKMMQTRDLRQRLEVIAEAIREIGWRRVVISVRDEHLEITDLVTEGLTKEEVRLLLKRKSPGKIWRERLGPKFNRFKIGEFYYLPWSDPWVREKVHGVPPDASPEETTTYTGVPSKISPEEMIDWHPQDLFYAPLRLPNGRIVGIISIDDPLDGRRPTKDSLIPLELFLYQAAVAIENAQLMGDLHARGEALRESEEGFRLAFENAKDAIIWGNPETGLIINCNKAAEMLLEKTRGEIIGHHQITLHPPQKAEYYAKMFKRHVEQEEAVDDEGEVMTKTGKIKPVHITASATLVAGKPIIQGIFRDITERKKTEELYKSMVELSPNSIITVDTKGVITSCNAAATRMLGYSADEMIGNHFSKIGVIRAGDLPKFLKLFVSVLKGKVTKPLELTFHHKAGAPFLAEVHISLLKEDGNTVGLQAISRDITERKRFEERLSTLNIYSRNLNTARSMKEIYRLTLDAMEKTLGFEHASFMIVDKNMLRIMDQYGYPESLSLKLPLNRKKGVTVKAARTGMPILVPDTEKDEAYVQGMPDIHSELAVPIKIGHKVLGVLNVESKRLDAFNEKDQKLLEILASHAVTAISNLQYAKNLEMHTREIQESKQKFERLFMNNPEAADYLDPDFRIMDVNPRFEELFGYSLDEIKGKHINDVIVPKDKIKEAKMLDEKAGERIVCYDTVRKTKDGSLVPVSISAAPITVEGKLIGTVGLYKDISQLKKTEKTLKETMKKLETMNEKLRVVGSLTRHDVRNKLSAVTGNVFLAKRRLTSDHEVLECLKDVESACWQIERIFNFARTYERLGVEELLYMDVEKSLGEAISLFSDLHGAKIVNDCHGLTVLADSLLNQLFYNLIDNSLRHGEKVRRIRVHYEETGKDQLKLIYEDDGVGISMAEKEKIFNEGYGKGAGYGLHLIRKICEVYSWTIRETGKKDKGAQFTITIPKENYRLH